MWRARIGARPVPFTVRAALGDADTLPSAFVLGACRIQRKARRHSEMHRQLNGRLEPLLQARSLIVGLPFLAMSCRCAIHCSSGMKVHSACLPREPMGQKKEKVLSWGRRETYLRQSA